MSATGLSVFDKTLQSTNVWLDELMAEIGPDRQLAWHTLGVVLRTLRDRLPTDLAAHLGSQLPILVRGAYYDQWQPERSPHRTRTIEEFLHEVVDGLSDTQPVNAAEAAKAAIHVLCRHVDPGQLAKVRGALPKEIQQGVWPEGLLNEARAAHASATGSFAQH